MVFIDEAMIEYDPCLVRKKVCMQLDEEVYKKNWRRTSNQEESMLGFLLGLQEEARQA